MKFCVSLQEEVSLKKKSGGSVQRGSNQVRQGFSTANMDDSVLGDGRMELIC